MATTPRVFIKRTATDNAPPTGLAPGELSVEMGVPPRLWVGVPAAQDPTEKKLLSDPTDYVTISGGGGVGGDVPYANMADFGTDGAALVAAIETGKIVIIPASITDITVPFEDIFTVTRALYRIHPTELTTIRLPANQSGVPYSVATGNLGRIGQSSANIKLLGATPFVTTLNSIFSVTGTPRDWTVQIDVASAAGIGVGDVVKLWNVGPLPLLAGDYGGNTSTEALRLRCLPNELNSLNVPLGTITFASGGGSALFNKTVITGGVSSYVSIGDLLHCKGQTRQVTAVSSPTVNVTPAWTNGVTATRGYWHSRANSGTAGTGGVPSVNVAITGGLALTEANDGDILLVNGEMRKIVSIGSNASVTVTHNITIANGTPYSFLTTGILHEGAHEVIAVSANRITVKNKSNAKPPKVMVTTGEVKAIKTVLKNTGTGDGFSFDQDGQIYWINDIALQGNGSTSTGPIGLLMQGRYDDGWTQIGGNSNAAIGNGVGILNFGHNITVGYGGHLQVRRVACSGSAGVNVWLFEGSQTLARNLIVSGSGDDGLQCSSGAAVKLTDGRLVGNLGDGCRFEIGSVCYAEIPLAYGNGVIGFRSAGGILQINEGVSLCNGISGVRFEQGRGRCSRVVTAGNGRYGVDAVDGSTFDAGEIWATGNIGSGAYGVGIYLERSKAQADGSAVRGNQTHGCNLLEASELNAETSVMTSNLLQDVIMDRSSLAIISNGEVGKITITGGSTAWIDGVVPAPVMTGGRETTTIPANAWIPTTTAGATRATTEAPTNDLMFESINFPDGSVTFATYQWHPPKRWDPLQKITFRFRWKASAGTGNVAMAISAVAISHGDILDSAPGSLVAIPPQSFSGVGLLNISEESGPITIAGVPVSTDMIVFKLQRNVSSDTLTGDVMVTAVDIFWRSHPAVDRE